MSCPTFGTSNISISNSSLPSSVVLISFVSSTCTTASAPDGIGAPVLIRMHDPGRTDLSGYNITVLKCYTLRLYISCQL